jgi:cell division protein FtsQ
MPRGQPGPLTRVPALVARVLRKGAVLILLLLAAGILGVLGRDRAARVIHGSYFEISSFSVEGNRRVPAETIISSLGLPAHAGILEVDLNGLAGRIMRNPWIKTAAVSRRLPASLLIKVVERKPRTIILADHRAYLVSEDGLILKEAGSDDIPGLPMLRLDVDRPHDVGERLDVARLEEGVRLWGKFDKEILASGARAVEIRLESGGSFTVSLGQGMPYLRVSGPRLDEELNRLAMVLRTRGIALQTLEYADLRFADKVIVKPVPKKGEA